VKQRGRVPGQGGVCGEVAGGGREPSVKCAPGASGDRGGGGEASGQVAGKCRGPRGASHFRSNATFVVFEFVASRERQIRALRGTGDLFAHPYLSDQDLRRDILCSHSRHWPNIIDIVGALAGDSLARATSVRT
jgi:hypothetical protein